MKKIGRLLVANRGEIAIRIFRACNELNIRTVAIYPNTDRYSPHRPKADEAYIIEGGEKSPYLDIDKIINLAVQKNVDAIHPGYGFLSENADFARACLDNNIIFIGPKPDVIKKMGEKIFARNLAEELNIPTIPGTKTAVKSIEEAITFSKTTSFPLMLKASQGGGGRGMRIVNNEQELREQIKTVQSEALKAFGNDDIFIEKYLQDIRHIEVQILADEHGNVVHLFERDCSIQRRHQKLIEFSPALNLSQKLKEKLYDDAKKIAKAVNYTNAGTIEFVVTPNEEYYFIEMNTRLQVEHTITEIITSIDIVQAQIRIAEHKPLKHIDIGIENQNSIKTNGYAIQSRITAEDPLNDFMPDTGRITAYRTSPGPGIRIDSAYDGPGYVITLDYDSLLMKVVSFGSTFKKAISKMLRSLMETRIRGIKNNIIFLENLVNHKEFISGDCKTNFIDKHPELFNIKVRKDRATKLLSYIGNITINGSDDVHHPSHEKNFYEPKIPNVDYSMAIPDGTRQLLKEKGPEQLSKWILQQDRLLITDTTFRDAQQSLISTRLRNYDIFKIANITTRLLPELFSFEMWGGATFDVCFRFLKEDPWERLYRLNEDIPNILLQMLIRGSNALGYANYPDNVVKEFIKITAEAGIDVFRIFDSLNWMNNMKVAIEATLKTGKICEPAICYTGDILDKNKTKYDLKYYINLAKEIERMGAHILGIKDMAGLCKPLAAYELVKALKQEIGIPIHFHTHDTSANSLSSVLKACEAGVDIVDAAIGQMSGLTSQPNLNSIVHTFINQKRECKLNTNHLQQLSDYWEVTREYYYPFESGLKSGTTDVYRHEIPGGQYSNLKRRAVELGLGHRWTELKDTYAEVNYELGNIVKVTPSSKMIADFAMFMLKQDLSFDDIYKSKYGDIQFPQSVIDYFKGMLGQPKGGFPEKLSKIILKNNKERITTRPGENLAPYDFKQAHDELHKKFKRKFSDKEVMSYIAYPAVFMDFVKHTKEYGDTSLLPTRTFFYGLNIGEEINFNIEEGKSLIVELQAVGKLQKGGHRKIHFDLNAKPRDVLVKDNKASITVKANEKAEADNPKHIGAAMSGTIIRCNVEVGMEVKVGETLIILEAMKMQNNVLTKIDGVIEKIYHEEGEKVDQEDLLILIK